MSTDNAEPATASDLATWMRHDPEWARQTAARLASLLGEWVAAWEGPTGDPYNPDNGPLGGVRDGLYAESKAILATPQPGEPRE